MQIYSTSQMGTFHLHHNEDHFCVAPIGRDRQLVALMDGCSMGLESYFAATLFAKLLRKIARHQYHLEFRLATVRPLEQLLADVLATLFNDLRQLQNHCALNTEELLCTLLLGLLDQPTRQAHLCIIGDGLVVCDGEVWDFDQDDRPDYLAYHLRTPFDEWYRGQRRLRFSAIRDLGFATDGIFTFRPFDTRDYPPRSTEAILHHLLLQVPPRTAGPDFLRQQVYALEADYGLRASDDLTLLRILFPKPT